jgi:hypothetical protein
MCLFDMQRRCQRELVACCAAMGEPTSNGRHHLRSIDTSNSTASAPLPSRSPLAATINGYHSHSGTNSGNNSPRSVPARTLSGERRQGGLSRSNSEPHLVLNVDEMNPNGTNNPNNEHSSLLNRGRPDGTTTTVSRDDTICGGGTRHDRARKALRRAKSMGRAKSMYDFGSIKTLLLASSVPGKRLYSACSSLPLLYAYGYRYAYMFIVLV